MALTLDGAWERGEPLEVRREEIVVGVEIEPVEGVDPPLHDLHVLPRHRLLLQPHGFEGFVLARVNPKPPQLAVKQRPDVRLALLDGYSASLSPTTRTKHRD